MKAFFVTLLMCCLIKPIAAQDITHNLSRHEADSLMHLLTLRIPETTYMDVLLKIAQFNILKPGESPADLDSAASYIDRAKHLTNRVSAPEYEGNLKFTQALLFREKGERKKGKAAVEKAIRILKPTRARHIQGLAYYELAQYDDLSDPAGLQQKIHLTEQAASLFDQPADIELKAFSLKMLADLYNYEGLNRKALENINASYRIYKAVHFKKIQSVYTIYASIYYSNADFIQALKYELAALETSKSQRDTSMQLCEIHNGIGAIYTKLKDYRKAIEYFKIALLTAEKYHDDSSVILLTYNTVNSFIHLARPQEALQFLKEIPGEYLKSNDPSINYYVPMSRLVVLTALHEFRPAKPYADQLHAILLTSKLSFQDRIQIHVVLIKYFIASRQYEAALAQLEKNDALLQTKKDPAALSRNYELWFTLDTLRGRYQSAVSHLLANNKLNDSVANANKTRQITQITTFYKNEERAAAIKLLEAKSRLQQAQLMHAEHTRNWIIGLLIMLFALLLAGMDRYRVKQRNNKLLVAKQVRISNANKELVAQKKDLQSENEWLMNEIHHRVKNNLHTVVSLLESQASFLKNDALRAIEKSQHRIYAMSLVHQQLYDPENMKTVDFAGFVPEFVRYLSDSYDIHKKIRFQLNIEQIRLGIAQAIPVALIINEAITNAIEYAFSGRRSGMISMALFRSADLITLVIEDDGIGINPGRADAPSDSLGLVLMNGLSKDIGGKITVENDHGTRISMVFNSNANVDGPI